MRTSLSSSFHPPLWNLQLDCGHWRKGQPRVFVPEISQDDKDHIKFIVSNLAKKSLVGLWKLKKELKKRGEKVNHVHPLSFFIAVLSSDCIHHFYDLKARKGMPYSEFLKGAIESFHDEKKHNNLTPEQIQVFAQTTNRNQKQIAAFLQAKDYTGLINWL